MKLYPLKFQPIYKYRIWGGDKLKEVLNKEYDDVKIGESWEVSDVSGSETQVSNGPLKGSTLKMLIKEYGSSFLGCKVYEIFGEDFPLLIKFIDAKKPLSIQVHPDDEISKKRHNSFGKNEMWYILQADDAAEIVVGFKKKVSKKTFMESVDNTTVMNVLNVEKPIRGDVFYIPTGRVHAIGSGVLLAEIQQTSDITYRIYDYDRVDQKTGMKRDLHNDLAIDVIDYNIYDSYKTDYTAIDNMSTTVIHTPYFKTNLIKVTEKLSLDYSNKDSFVVLICVEDQIEIIHETEIYTLQKGETILIPATLKDIDVLAKNATLLEVSI